MKFATRHSLKSVLWSCFKVVMHRKWFNIDIIFLSLFSRFSLVYFRIRMVLSKCHWSPHDYSDSQPFLWMHWCGSQTHLTAYIVNLVKFPCLSSDFNTANLCDQRSFKTPETIPDVFQTVNSKSIYLTYPSFYEASQSWSIPTGVHRQQSNVSFPVITNEGSEAHSSYCSETRVSSEFSFWR